MFSSILYSRKVHHLAGPIQMVNHSCSGWNARYVTGEAGSSLAFLRTTRFINAGEELLVHYEQKSSRAKNTWAPGCDCCPAPGTLALTHQPPR